MAEAIRQGDIPGVQLRCRQAFEIGRHELWVHLADPERLSQWLCESAAVVEGEGGSLRLESVDDEGRKVEESAATLEWDPPRRWALALKRPDWEVGTRLELELAERPDGCELSVLQGGFEHLPLSAGLTIWEAYRKRWRQALSRLARTVAA